MRLGSLANSDLAARLRGPGLALKAGPFVFRIKSRHSLVTRGLSRLYDGAELADDDQFADFSLTIDRGAGLRRWFRPQARFLFDGRPVFEPLPADQAYAMLEWAMNWCISVHAHQYLIVHAAVVERRGLALIMPAPPGSGKSTLCAALVQSGWRLLSDELALVGLADGLLWPLGRPVGLKNASIELIRGLAPGAVFGPVANDTLKGRVAHMKAPTPEPAVAESPARPHWIVFPKYEAGAPTQLAQRTRAKSAVDLARNAFNFALLGTTGFDALTALVRACECHDFRYSRLAEAIALFDHLADGTPSTVAAVSPNAEPMVFRAATTEAAER